MKNIFEDVWYFVEEHFEAIFALALTIGMIVLVVAVAKVNISNWNDGICSDCGKGAYIYVEAVGHRTYSSYVYECDNCGHKTETSILH